ncbi:hypothetical protein HPB47_009618 [Ixodes persulcatus]|uniref:Uncharacterized protein n=1 Tax=Ixodes persulcatus TaxID=34615 RepID=A0AC60P1E0_IXOPE|nr:hypothetical protein HPB47_009618 [Ixodes persulcatus]
MPGILWDQLDDITMSRLSVELIKEELANRQLDITGPKEELIKRLTADIAARREASPPVPSLDPVTLQNLSVLLQHLPRQPTTVTTLPDLSASIPHFEGSSKQDVKTCLLKRKKPVTKKFLPNTEPQPSVVARTFHKQCVTVAKISDT